MNGECTAGENLPRFRQMPNDSENDWLERAACKGTPTDLFFTERGESTAAAKAVCSSCPVKVQCLEEALKANDRFGVRGGKSDRERRRLRRERKDQAVAPSEGVSS